jgi:uncharacterized damage-inducible protein DinB
MNEADFEVEHGLEILKRTPALLRTWLDGLPERWITSNEGPDTWSPYDVVGHLIHGENTDWIPRAKLILEGKGDKPFPPFDRFAQFKESKGKTFEGLLAEFEEARRRSLIALEGLGLTEEDLNLTGTHPEFGTVTLRQLLATWITHDLSHVAQIARVIAKQQTEAVGPWMKYLSVLHPR